MTHISNARSYIKLDLLPIPISYLHQEGEQSSFPPKFDSLQPIRTRKRQQEPPEQPPAAADGLAHFRRDDQVRRLLLLVERGPTSEPMVG